jgi:carbonic anhydrase/acetyltransferase-like protein (isoleucine patch superfamily)
MVLISITLIAKRNLTRLFKYLNNVGYMHLLIQETTMILSIAVILILILVITTISIQIFINMAAAVPQQKQEPQQLAILPNNINNTNINDSILLSSSSSSPTINIRPSIQTDFNPNATYPRISKFAYLDPLALVIGDCEIGRLALVAPFAVCRGDEGTPIHIGDYSNMQDGVILHALETTSHGKNIDDRRYSAEGSLLKANNSEFKNGFAIYVGDKVSLAHGVQVHGPVYIGNDTFVGMNSFIFNAKIGKRVAIGVSSTITDGVTIPDNKFVPPGSIIATQAQADALPPRVGSPYEKINRAVLHVNQELAKGYDARIIQRLATEIEDELEQEEMLQTGSPTGNPNVMARR